MKKLFAQMSLVAILSFFCFGSTSAKQMYCHPGWGGGDHGYDAFTEVIVSDKPISPSRVRGEADPGYKTQKGAQVVSLRLELGWNNKEVYGNNAVLRYYPHQGTKVSFARANYVFAKECLVKELSQEERKQMEKASLNPKPKRRK